MSAHEIFLDQQFPVPGVVAAALRLPNRPAVTRCDGDTLTPAQVEKALARLAKAAAGLQARQIEARRLCWTFERACVHFVRRPDGAALALFATRGAAAPAPDDLRHLFSAFAVLH